MKVLIQHPQTRQFLRSDDRWTRDPDEAIDFRFSLAAATYGMQRLKRPFLILFKFETVGMDFTMDTYAPKTRSLGHSDGQAQRSNPHHTDGHTKSMREREEEKR